MGDLLHVPIPNQPLPDSRTTKPTCNTSPPRDSASAACAIAASINTLALYTSSSVSSQAKRIRDHKQITAHFSINAMRTLFMLFRM